MKVLKVPIPVFGWRVHFFFGEEGKKDFLSATGADPRDLEDARGVTSNNAIWVEDSSDLDVIVHEIVHTVDSMMVDRGLRNDSEVRAYHVGYIFKQVLDKLLKENANK